MGSRQTEHGAAADEEECPSGREGDCGSCPNESSTNRRLLLKSVATGGTVALAGCAGLFTTEPEEEPDNYVNESLQDEDDGTDTGSGNGDANLYSVEFLRNEATLDISSDEAILDVGLEEELDLPYQCKVGRCGQCEARVKGDARDYVEIDGQEALDEEDNAEGAFLTCVSSPKTDFAFDERPDAEGDPLSEIESGGGTETFDVTYFGNGADGTTVEVGTDETLLVAGEDEGWDLPFQCREGYCGQCEASYDGNANDVVDMSNPQALDEEEIENGALLTCVSTPKTDFEFDTDPEA